MEDRQEVPVLDLRTEYFKLLGKVVSVMLQCPAHRRLQIAAIGLWIDPALLLEQVEVVDDGRGEAVAYLCWAMVSDDVLRRLRMGEQSVLHVSEFNEGTNFWIIDFACRPNTFHRSVRSLYRALSSHAVSGHFVANGAVGTFPQRRRGTAEQTQ